MRLRRQEAPKPRKSQAHFKTVKGKQISYTTVNGELGGLILALHLALESRFHLDFAYTIRARGKLLAASNAEYGRVFPKLPPKE